MEKKKTGRKSLGLSESAKKERNKEQDKKRQSATRTVLMSIATHERWVELAERYGLTSRQLAVVLLDAVDDGKLHIDSSKLFESETAINRLSHQDTSEEPQPSDELDYQIYTLKEEVSEDSWTAEDVANQIPEEKESVVEPESNNHLDNAKKLEVEAIHQEVPPIDGECAHHTDKVHGDCIGDGEEMEPKPPAGYQILYVKEEQLDSDDTGDHDADANPGIMGQSLKEEAGDTIPESSDSVHHLDEHSTQAGFSEKRSLRNDNLPPQSQLLLKRYSGNCGVDTTMNTISSSAIPRTSSARRSKKSGEELRLDHERPNSKRSENHQKHLVEEERIHHSRLSKLRMREIEIERRQRMARLKHKGDGSRQSSRGFQPQSGDKSHHDDVSHLIGHYSVQQKQYRCSVCSKEYKYEGRLLTHMETHKEENFLRCTFCQKDFSSMSSLNNHKRTHSAHCKKKPFKCTICDKEFYQKSSFEGHMRLHMGRRSRGFQPKPGYKSHDDDVSHCTEHFSSSSELDSQMDPSEGEGLMGEYCPPNNVTPVQEHIVERDMEAAASSVLMVTGTTTVGELEMNDDGKMTSSLDVAESSKLLSISMQQKQLRCSVCSKEYKYEGSLLTHMKAHKDENVTPVQELNVERDVEEARSSVLMLTGTDTECELERNDDSEMTSSLGSAESSEPSPLSTQQEQYRCSVCSKEYKYKRSLLTHIETHKEENFLRCTLCQKDFSNMSSLNKHKRTHSAHCKTKPFKCTICDKEFYEKSSLDIHMRLHTGDKPHRCTMCDMKFPHYTSLTRHVFVVHHT